MVTTIPANYLYTCSAATLLNAIFTSIPSPLLSAVSSRPPPPVHCLRSVSFATSNWELAWMHTSALPLLTTPEAMNSITHICAQPGPASATVLSLSGRPFSLEIVPGILHCLRTAVHPDLSHWLSLVHSPLDRNPVSGTGTDSIQSPDVTNYWLL
ncbi:hypothetical protein AVEN_192282-1 [Araneus ventricosus]|uniref:Uncharacterized protein n=1 Tax=Araneus ventricosus TaxID=182803 RepID=A0A4Y2TW14_ARAVE|nr:hypothetical protein AVEN_192282-1 [Araneus ventricosus]